MVKKMSLCNRSIECIMKNTVNTPMMNKILLHSEHQPPCINQHLIITKEVESEHLKVTSQNYVLGFVFVLNLHW